DDAELAEVLETIGVDVKARIAVVRDGLRSILEVLSRAPGSMQLADLPRIEPGSNGSGQKSKPASKPRVVARGKTAAARKRPAPPKARVTKGKRGRLRT